MIPAKMAHLAVVIPVYKGEDCLDELLRRLVGALSAITENFRIVLVEDNGGDGSWRMIEAYSQAEPRICGLHFSRNFGQHTAIAAGLDHCDSEWVVVMDCDLQDAPEEIERLYRKALEGFDVVLARRIRRNEGRGRQFLAVAFGWLFERLTGRNYDPRVGAFRILSRRVVLAYRQFHEQTRLLGGAIDWLGFPTSSIDVEQLPRFAGESTYRFGKLLRLALDGIIAYSDRPLRLSIKAGLAIAAMSLLLGVGLVFKALFGTKPVEGWTSVIVSIYFIGGLIIANLGLVGAYIGKIYEESKGRPPYVIADAVGTFLNRQYHFTKPSDDRESPRPASEAFTNARR